MIEFSFGRNLARNLRRNLSPERALAYPSYEGDRMKGNEGVIAVLNETLKAELTAINQYFLHAEMCENWGYMKLASYLRKESIDEMKHAEALMERILYLDGMPTMNELFPLRIGRNVKEQIQNDLNLELDAIPRLNQGIAL